MKFKLTLLILMSCFTLQAQQWIDQNYAYDSTLNMFYGTATNFMGGVDSLRMDLYTPICDDSTHTSKRPLLIWVHGGAFIAGDKAEMTNLCKQFARRGYVTATIDYRLGFISDDTSRTCNFPNYNCFFATETSEWPRAYYRGVQDGKGALRYLVNRNSQYRIDTDNIFVAGESAGAFVALGIALMDTAIERLPQTFQLNPVARPHSSTSVCVYNVNQTFPNPSIDRPDLGGIDGTIEPTTIPYTIKGIGNNYGGMMSDLLKFGKANQPKPAIYSFHQPCDLIVPIDSGIVYQLLNWCFGNGYNCYGIANTPKVYGSRAFSNWNTANSYGYTIQNEFTATTFPYSYLFGTASCVDQVNIPCHAYDNPTLRQNNLAGFFAPLISTNPICLPTTIGIQEPTMAQSIQLFPNPASDKITIQCKLNEAGTLQLFNPYGMQLFAQEVNAEDRVVIDLAAFPAGLYFIQVNSLSGGRLGKAFVKQ